MNTHHDSMVIRLKKTPPPTPPPISPPTPPPPPIEEKVVKEEVSQTVVPSVPRASYRTLFIVASGIVILGGLGLFFAFGKNEAQQNTLAPSAAITQKDAEDLVTRVGALMELPNEVPTIATVTDLAPLKDQAFFKNASVGDKVLMYTGAGRAILYDPRTNKILEVAPITNDLK